GGAGRQGPAVGTPAGTAEAGACFIPAKRAQGDGTIRVGRVIQASCLSAYMKKNATLSLLLALLFAATGAAAAPASASPLKSQLRWVPASLGPGHVTLDASSRLLL